MQHYRDALVEVFSEFYGGDKQDMPGQCVDDTRIECSFSAKKIDFDFTGSAEQVELPNMGTLVLAQMLLT